MSLRGHGKLVPLFLVCACQAILDAGRFQFDSGSSGSGSTGSVGGSGGGGGGAPPAPKCGDGTPAPHEICFGNAPKKIPTQATNAVDFRVFDCDNDGDLDIVILDKDKGLTALQNVGVAVFAAPAHTPLVDARSIAVGDFDPAKPGLELAVAHQGKAAKISFFVADKMCRYKDSGLSPVQIETDPAKHISPEVMEAGDLNKDQKPDLVLITGGDGKEGYYWLNSPSNAVAQEHKDYYGLSIAIGDLTGDGYPEVAHVGTDTKTDSGKYRWVFLHQNTAGILGTDQHYPTTEDLAKGPAAVLLGDLDGDADLDAVTVSYWGDSFNLLHNTGKSSGVLASMEASQPVGGMKPLDAALDDIDRDGKRDLVTANSGSHDVSLFVRDESGKFHMAQPGGPLANKIIEGVFPRPSLQNAADIALADMNGDEALDIVVSAAGTAEIQVFLANP